MSAGAPATWRRRQAGSLFTVFIGGNSLRCRFLSIWGLGCSLSQILNICCVPLKNRADDRGHRGDVLSSCVPGSETSHLSGLLGIMAAHKHQQFRCGVKSYAGVSASPSEQAKEDMLL